MNVIKVENISKLYRLGQVGTGSIFHDVNRWWHEVRGKEDPYMRIGEENDRTQKGKGDYIWALKDINFEVAQGEVLGIIGRNGAGKSTLLKILSRTTAPTTGSIKVKGRIASLLEVGTGFHPELSGRDNIFMNGTILGMTRAEIKSRFDEIVEFAGIARYLDTPVKRYSSGMYVRLAFAVAAHLESEILIVDEVLAVGDTEFQKKCLGKMKDVSEKQGRTVLFVSHNIEALQNLTNKCGLLSNGRMISFGDKQDILDVYLQDIYKTFEVKSSFINDTINPNSKFHLSEVRLLSNNKLILNRIDSAEDFFIKINYCVLDETIAYTHSINLYNSIGVHVLSSHDVSFYKEFRSQKKGSYSRLVRIPKYLLAEDTYYVSVAIISYNPFVVHFHEMDAVVFEIYDRSIDNEVRGIYTGKFPGIVRPILDWSFY
jgi:lipopolysaccharide transport system ATP-binding protein